MVEALLGIEVAHPDLRVDHHNKVVYRADAPSRVKAAIRDLDVERCSVVAQQALTLASAAEVRKLVLAMLSGTTG